MQVIQHIELGSNAAQIDFTSIPNTFTDLMLVCSIRTTRTGVTDNLRLIFNSDTANGSSRWLFGSGSGSGSSGTRTIVSGGSISSSSATSNTFGSSLIYIPNYTSSTAKSVSTDSVAENNGTDSAQIIEAGLWNSSSVISSIRVNSETGSNFVQGSSATLYGITKGSDGTTTVS